MKQFILAGAIHLAATAMPVWADCNENFVFLFGCEFPEHNASVQLCRNTSTGESQYKYWADGQLELSFISSVTPAGVKESLRNISSDPLGMAAVNGTTYYAIWADPDYTSAVLHVYENETDFQAFSSDQPITRRVCYPQSIEVNDEWFGPG